MIEPFDSFDEFTNPVIKGVTKEQVKESIKKFQKEKREFLEKEQTKTRGRKKKVAEPVDIPAEVPALEE